MNSMFLFQATMPDYVYTYDVNRVFPFTPYGYHTVRQWYSPSGSYLQIEPITDVPACDSYLTFNVTHISEPANSVTFFYQV